MFRRRKNKLEVLLAHPGGPFHVHKDDGAWTIPKGEAAPGEDLLTRAKIEFEEEVGFRPESSQGWIELGSIVQKGRQNCTCLGIRRRFTRTIRVQVKSVRTGMATAFWKAQDVSRGRSGVLFF